jgi:hypothetical protein
LKSPAAPRSNRPSAQIRPTPEFGNRIPQLTFEVETDAAPVTCGMIAGALSALVKAEARVPSTEAISGSTGWSSLPV